MVLLVQALAARVLQVLQTLQGSQTEQLVQAEDDKQFAQALQIVEAEEHAQVEALVRLGQIVQIEEVEQVLIAAGAADVVKALEKETALHTMALLEPSVLAGSESGYREEMSVLTFDQTLVLVRMILM